MKRTANDAAHWRDFDQNYVTHSMAHYLTAIDSLRKELGYARATDVADFLDVSRGAASMALAQLKKRGWVAEDPNRFLLLTEEGAHIAELVEQNFTILTRFFEEVLGAPHDRALSDACKMEHLMSMETGQRLVWLMRHLLEDEKELAHVRKAMRGFEPIEDREPHGAAQKRASQRVTRQTPGARQQRG